MTPGVTGNENKNEVGLSARRLRVAGKVAVAGSDRYEAVGACGQDGGPRMGGGGSLGSVPPTPAPQEAPSLVLQGPPFPFGSQEPWHNFLVVFVVTYLPSSREGWIF